MEENKESEVKELRPASTLVRLSEAEVRKQRRQEILSMSIAQIGLLVRTTNCLESEGILTVRDLLNSSPERLLKISNFGNKTLLEVYDALEKLGFTRETKRELIGESQVLESETTFAKRERRPQSGVFAIHILK